MSKPQWATELFKLITPKQTIKIGQQYVGPSFSYNPHYSFVAKRIASLPKEGRFSHTLLVTITLVFRFLCGLIHYDEADVTVWKRSIVGVMHSTGCSSQGGRSSPNRASGRILHHLAERPAPADTVNKMLSSHYYGNYGFLKST